MSLCEEGLTEPTKGGKVTLHVEDNHPLILLANLIDWAYLAELVHPDLRKTQKRFWWLGRRLHLRIHLAVMLLQILFKWTDRATESCIKSTGVYQIFCGLHLIRKWSFPDHTKIEDFRNRLSPLTHKAICDYIVQLAVQVGFAGPSHLDIDSTVQEANMSYPSDSHLMKKLSEKCFHLLSYLQEKWKSYLPKDLNIDIKSIVRSSQSYFFLAKNTCLEKRREIFSQYHALVKKELKPLLKLLESLSPRCFQKLPWNYREAALEVREKGWRYLLDVAHFIRKHTIKEGKILSLKLKDVVCVKKGKVGKDCEFGRVFQVGRIVGNFLVAYTSHSLRMVDKESLIPIIEEHQQLFGQGVLESVTTDKGYYSHANVQYVKEQIGNADGLQRPANIKNQVVVPQKQELFNRRAGVEPLIGHAKQYGLGKSKMKSDRATLALGYRSVTGFNLHQLMRGLRVGCMT